MTNHVKRLGILCTPDPQIKIESPTRSQKRGTVVTSKKEKDTPQSAQLIKDGIYI